MNQCLICMEEKPYMTIGNCGHAFTCLECTYKFRVISKSKRCAYCNIDLEMVLVYPQSKPIPNISEMDSITEFKGGIFYADSESRIECLKLENKQCVIGQCKTFFQTIPQLYSHLKSSHGRFMCNLCVENRALLIREQKAYRKEEYDRHLNSGDYDEENNLIFLHPYCCFCETNFFNDDALADHLRKGHFNCNLCDPKIGKYTYYREFANLRKHYNASHFMCTNADCQGGSAFRTKPELDSHVFKEHDKSKNKKLNSNVLLSAAQDDLEIKRMGDKEGIDFTNSVN